MSLEQMDVGSQLSSGQYSRIESVHVNNSQLMKFGRKHLWHFKWQQMMREKSSMELE